MEAASSKSPERGVKTKNRWEVVEIRELANYDAGNTRYGDKDKSPLLDRQAVVTCKGDGNEKRPTRRYS